LDTLKCLPLGKLVHVFARVAAGMEHMHRRNAFHADLKPNNIMLSRAGDVKIIDFGLAWVRGESKNRVQGTPEYMAPEQASRRLVNAQTDVYNFGATMYRLTTGQLPPTPIVAGGNLPLDARSWAQLLKPVHETNREAPPELCDLIRRCLAFNPQQRPEQMSEVKDVLESLTQKLSVSREDLLEEIEW
jgi:serine/threonine protein kinase